MRYYYAGCCQRGVNIAFDWTGWEAYRFTSKKSRDNFVEKHWYSEYSSNVVCQAITYNQAMVITRATKHYPMDSMPPDYQNYIEEGAERLQRSEDIW